MENSLIDSTLIVIVLGCFVAAFVNAAFATGGVYIMLLSSVSVLPISHAIPLQTAFAVGSLTGRLYYFWRYIDWRIVKAFVIGSLFGVYLGTRAFVALPDDILSLLLGLVLLFLIWMPTVDWRMPFKHPFFIVGAIHSYLGALFGVGGVLQPLVLRTRLNKLEITGTLAICMFTLDMMKTVGYISVGFNYLDYVPHFIGATLAGFLGTWLGKRVTHRVSEQLFRRVFKVLVSLVAVRLILKGWLG